MPKIYWNASLEDQLHCLFVSCMIFVRQDRCLCWVSCVSYAFYASCVCCVSCIDYVVLVGKREAHQEKYVFLVIHCSNRYSDHPFCC